MNGRTALRWSGYVAVAVAFAIACAFLSNWQFARNESRSEQLALVEANYDAEPVPMGELIAADGVFSPADEWRPVELVGEYLPEQQVLVRNRPHGGTSAFEVLVPFRTEDGRVFVVDRGWLPPAADSPDPASVPAPPSGAATVVARLKPVEAAPTSGRSAPAGQVPTINLDLVVAEAGLGDETITSAYGQLVSEDPAPETAPGALPTPTEDPGPHLSYAIQWILFAIMGFVFIWYMIRTEVRHRREDAAEAAAAAAGSASTTTSSSSMGAGAADAADRLRVPVAASVVPPSLRRRSGGQRDRDMQDEDAILDSSRN